MKLFPCKSDEGPCFYNLHTENSFGLCPIVDDHCTFVEGTAVHYECRLDTPCNDINSITECCACRSNFSSSMLQLRSYECPSNVSPNNILQLSFRMAFMRDKLLQLQVLRDVLARHRKRILLRLWKRNSCSVSTICCRHIDSFGGQWSDVHPNNRHNRNYERIWVCIKRRCSFFFPQNGPKSSHGNLRRGVRHPCHRIFVALTSMTSESEWCCSADFSPLQSAYFPPAHCGLSPQPKSASLAT